MFWSLSVGPRSGCLHKAFTGQLAVLACLALAAAESAASCRPVRKPGSRVLAGLRLLSEALKLDAELEHLARSLAHASDVLYLGRGTSFPIALEGALKLKELPTSPSAAVN